MQRIRNLTTDTKVIVVLSAIGILASVIAAVLNVVFEYNQTFNFIVKIYIGVMVFAMGVLILALRNEKIKFSMKRIIGLGGLAGFNKGISGGGYRPVTVIGQMLAGREGKNALASTTFSKTAVSMVGLLAYILTHVVLNIRGNMSVSWEYLEIAPYLIVGAIIAAPIGAVITKKVEAKWLKVAVGSGTIILGAFSLLRLSLLELGIWQKIPKFFEIINL
ncbi:MAG: sulfite exporter TauE/SafE family protein [Asgard group archaeon]|nr:sulfite exporter TauE/SafE family protein [Asgard group archaeon]